MTGEHESAEVDRVYGLAEPGICENLHPDIWVECQARVVYDPAENRPVHEGDHRDGLCTWTNDHPATQAQMSRLRIDELSPTGALAALITPLEALAGIMRRGARTM